MPKVTRICRVCGKQYVACATPNYGVFRYTDVACSKECGQEYLRQVLEARGESGADNVEPVKPTTPAAATTVEEVAAPEEYKDAGLDVKTETVLCSPDVADTPAETERKEAEEVTVARTKKRKRKR